MLNLDETLQIIKDYIIQRDLYLKGFVYITGVFVFLDILRSQVSEINLLQLIPGFYLLLLFVSFVLLLFISNFSLNIPLNIDSKKSLGTKTITKMNQQIKLKLSFYFFCSVLFLILKSVIPVSLDSFDSYDQETLTNLWSFDEVLSLESFLLTILLILSQIPIVVIINFNTEKDINILLEYWKLFSFIIFIFAGIITPTIDGYTQFNFAVSAISLYLLVISIIGKRIIVKFNGIMSLN